MLDVDEEVLGSLAEAGNVKSRRPTAQSTSCGKRSTKSSTARLSRSVGECEPSQLVSRMDRTCSRSPLGSGARSEGG